jgi:hypothetical protein
MKIRKLVLLVSLLLCVGCPKRIVLPDDGQVHQLAQDSTLTVWCHGPDGDSWTKCVVTARKGSWIAPASVVDAQGKTP